MKNYILLTLLVILGSTTTTAQTKNKLAQKIANYYGIANYKNAKTIAYTFNVTRDTTTTSRSWVWDIATNTITMQTAKETVTYKRDTIQVATIKATDQKFINDQYWLLFPYHLLWDEGTTITNTTNQIAPISKQPMDMLTIQYGTVGGYTPGDAYDLYIDNDGKIMEWNFRKGGTAKPSLSTTWENNVTLKGITMATDHKTADGKFRLFFTNVTVK